MPSTTEKVNKCQKKSYKEALTGRRSDTAQNEYPDKAGSLYPPLITTEMEEENKIGLRKSNQEKYVENRLGESERRIEVGCNQETELRPVSIRPIIPSRRRYLQSNPQTSSSQSNLKMPTAQSNPQSSSQSNLKMPTSHSNPQSNSQNNRHLSNSDRFVHQFPGWTRRSREGVRRTERGGGSLMVINSKKQLKSPERLKAHRETNKGEERERKSPPFVKTFRSQSQSQRRNKIFQFRKVETFFYLPLCRDFKEMLY